MIVIERGTRDILMRRVCPASAGCSRTVSKPDARCTTEFISHGIGIKEVRTKLTLSAGFDDWVKS